MAKKTTTKTTKPSSRSMPMKKMGMSGKKAGGKQCKGKGKGPRK